ncbi:hypothetical protein Y046_4781 [Burkholderia pseudomallei MSHR2990]|uniref:hypothetical protein n=1 Tax=Burkholderia pseudomallei TaxID=28450 RepID=UPI0005382760|nr:hypothetical protein [Burkholderia pseudomallei]KGW78506.1 hypothetical protein Y046_4781 [Burkholderia pseudomallei MSHR2990]
MDKIKSTTLGGLLARERVARTICVAATGVVWAQMAAGVTAIAVIVATSPDFHLNFLETLCFAPVVASTCLGFGVLSNGVHRWLLSLFSLKQIQRDNR